MEKEVFKKEAIELIEKSSERMKDVVEKFAESDYLGFDSYEEINLNDFMQALLQRELHLHSPVGCSQSFQRKCKKNVERLELSILYNH